jgi:hypothetical protein
MSSNRRGYCIFTNTLLQGPVPNVRECSLDNSGSTVENICVFETELDAQREIVDFMMTRLQQFLDGEREFDDAITVEEYVVDVDILPDGSIVDSEGKCF